MVKKVHETFLLGRTTDDNREVYCKGLQPECVIYSLRNLMNYDISVRFEKIYDFLSNLGNLCHLLHSAVIWTFNQNREWRKYAWNLS